MNPPTKPSDCQNTGHGHGFPRPDGAKARCGGPNLCTACAADPGRENAAVREALALAHAILAKIPPRDVVHAHKRAAIKHKGNDPMAYIAGVLANTKPHGYTTAQLRDALPILPPKIQPT